MPNQPRFLAFCLALIPTALILMPLSSLAAKSAEVAYYKGEVQPAPQVKTLHEGLYLGLALGYDSYRVRSDARETFNGDTISANPAVNATGFAGGILGGYGTYFKDLFYLGGEVFVNTTGASARSTFTDTIASSRYSNKISIGTSFGAALLPGLRVNDSSLVYLRFGYSCANIEAQENVTVAGVSANSDSNNWQRGYAYGLGIETAIYKALSLRTEYTHTEYNSFSSSFNTAYNTPYDNQFMLGLIYHLG